MQRSAIPSRMPSHMTGLVDSVQYFHSPDPVVLVKGENLPDLSLLSAASPNFAQPALRTNYRVYYHSVEHRKMQK